MGMPTTEALEGIDPDALQQAMEQFGIEVSEVGRTEAVASPFCLFVLTALVGLGAGRDMVVTEDIQKRHEDYEIR